MRLLFLLLPLVALALAACSPLGALNGVTNTAGLAVRTDLRYGEAPRQVLDVYAPEGARGAPVALFIHGGSWTGGDKAEYRFAGDSLARAGYVTLVMSYRLAPAFRYPAYVQDAALALRWARENAAAFGGDPDRLFVVGHSAGAFNAVEAVMNERWLREAGVPIASVRAVVGLAGPYDYDFRPLPSRNAFPEGADPADVMPSRHVRADPPPTLLVVAERDQVVAPENALRMEAALRARGADVTRAVVPGVDHYTVVGALARNAQFLGRVRPLVLDFMNARR